MGIDELRPVFFEKDKMLEIYASESVISNLKKMFYVVTWDGLMPSSLDEHFSIMFSCNTEKVATVYTT